MEEMIGFEMDRAVEVDDEQACDGRLTRAGWAGENQDRTRARVGHAIRRFGRYRARRKAEFHPPSSILDT